MPNGMNPVPTPTGYNWPDFGNTPDFDFLMHHNDDGSAPTYTGDSGLNLGFDVQHDFNERPQMPDLFGGFFFGGPIGEGGVGDATGFGMGGMEGTAFAAEGSGGEGVEGLWEGGGRG